MHDPVNAFCKHVSLRIAGAPAGPLAGTTFAAKDIFDVAGHVACCGNPDWLARHGPAPRTAPAIAAAIAAGATLVGKTMTEEFAFGMSGSNLHYGASVNSAAPGRITGGSSFGSAAAVAAGLVDFAIGSDTGGSVRVPASLCGIHGIRPSFGRVDATGMAPLGASFDTVGWFARDADRLAAVGGVLLGDDTARSEGKGLVVVEEAFAYADPAVAHALAPALDEAAALLGGRESISVDFGAALVDWVPVFRRLQGRDVSEGLGAWVKANRPRMDPEIAARIEWAMDPANAPLADDDRRRDELAGRLDDLLARHAAIAIPTAPSIAPEVAAVPGTMERFRLRALALTCIAGLARLPEVTLPVAKVDGCPVGLSLISRRGTDRWLLEFARRLKSPRNRMTRST